MKRRPAPGTLKPPTTALEKEPLSQWHKSNNGLVISLSNLCWLCVTGPLQKRLVFGESASAAKGCRKP